MPKMIGLINDEKSIITQEYLEEELSNKLNTSGGTITGDLVIDGGSLNIHGTAATFPLIIRSIVGSNGSGRIGPLYLQYGADNTIRLGNGGRYTISSDGSTYSGTSAKATADASGNVITDTYETKTDASAKLVEAKEYADSTAANKASTLDLTTHTNNKSNPHGVTLSQLGVTATATELNKLDGLTATVTELNYIDGVTSNIQTQINGKAPTSHGTHVTYSTTVPVMDGTASVGTASTVARSDHKHPVDTSRAAKADFDSHTGNTTIHITSAERTNWNAAKTHADSTHAPSNAQANQNAFSNIAVNGQTTVAADTTTDTVTFVGSNVSITTDATNDKVTFSVANGSTSTKGVVQLTNSASSTSTTTAATPNSVKSAYDLANTAKTNAATAQSKADSAYALAENAVPQTRKINGMTLTEDITVTAEVETITNTEIDEICNQILGENLTPTQIDNLYNELINPTLTVEGVEF